MPPPLHPGFSRANTHPKSIYEGEGNNAHSVNRWRGLSLFPATIMTKPPFCEHKMPPTLAIIRSPASSPPTQVWEMCYRLSEVALWKCFIGNISLRCTRRLLEEDGWFQDWTRASEDDVCSVIVAGIASNLVSLTWKFILCQTKEKQCLLPSPAVFNHIPSCGKLTPRHNCRPLRSGLCAITSIGLTWL